MASHDGEEEEEEEHRSGEVEQVERYEEKFFIYPCKSNLHTEC